MGKLVRRFFGYRFFTVLAVFFWLFGRLIVIVNALWLIASSLMEIVGAYDNCWRNSNHVSLGDQGWAMVFKEAHDLKAEAAGVWRGDVALSVVIAGVSFLCLLLGVKK